MILRPNSNGDKISPVSRGKSLYHEDKGTDPPHEAVVFPVSRVGKCSIPGECSLPIRLMHRVHRPLAGLIG